MIRHLGAVRLAAILFVMLAFAAPARSQDVVIGNWESASPEGWIDWNTGSLQDMMAPRFEFNAIGATLGTTALQYTLPSGYAQWAAIKLQLPGNGIDEWQDDFLANSKVAFDLTLVASEMAPGAGNDFATIGLTVNAQGYGFQGQPDPESANNNFNPSLLSGTTTRTIVWDVSATHDGDPSTGGGEIDPAPFYLELILSTYSNGGVVYHIDNFRLFTPALKGDFDNNGVVDDLDLGRWKTGFGFTGQTDDSNGDADGNGLVDGNDLLIWQRNLHPAEIAIAGVPEPATCGLLLAAGGGLALRSRRR